KEIVEPVGGDSSSLSGTRDGIVNSVEDIPVDLDGAIRDFYHHMFEVRVDRIVGIKTTKRQLEADQMIASGARASMADSIRSLRSENLKVRALLCIKRDCVDSLQMINRRVTESLEAQEINRNLDLENLNDNHNNGNGGNGNGNGNGGNGNRGNGNDPRKGGSGGEVH
nr:hypothetical protein [Tanacetum cinerariifolium]